MITNIINEIIPSIKTKLNFINVLLSIILSLVLSTLIVGQEKNKKLNYEAVENVSFCDMMESPSDFVEKNIKLHAIFRFGFEWSELTCLKCKGKIWLEYGSLFDDLTKSNIRKKVKWSEKGRTLNITTVGKLYISGGYGHLGGYKYKFVAEYFEDAEIILNDSPVTLTPKIQKKTKCRR
jgi:hypothetical protein